MSSNDLNIIGSQICQKIIFREYGGAIELLNKAIRKYPEEYKLYNNRAFCHFQLHNYEESFADSSYMIKKFPNFVKTYYRHGENLFIKKLYIEAEKMFLKVLVLDPTCVEAKIYLTRMKLIKLDATKKHNYQNQNLTKEQIIEMNKNLDNNKIELYYSDDENQEFKDETNSLILSKPITKKKGKKKRKNKK